MGELKKYITIKDSSDIERHINVDTIAQIWHYTDKNGDHYFLTTGTIGLVSINKDTYEYLVNTLVNTQAILNG